MSCGRLDGISLKFTVLPVENFQVFDIFKRPKHRVTVNPYPWILDKKIQILGNELASFLEIKSNKNSRDRILEIELASFLEEKSIFPYMIYLHNFLVVTVMFMTSLCWWLYDGDWFQMLVAKSLCWRLFSLCLRFFQCIKSITNILNRSSTSQTCHQRIWSPTSVTNIDVTMVYYLSNTAIL